jgi:hypothetical protein
MARTGKIARLPRNIRDQLNHRLDDGESGVRLVEWLNGLPEVQAVLDQDFEGRPISEQNLTEWKQGGFLIWARHQETWEWWRLNHEEGDRMATESGPRLLSDSLSPMVALVLGKEINDLFTNSPADPASRKQLIALLAELARLRRIDHEAARLRIHLEDQEKRRFREQKSETREAEEEVHAAARAAEQAASRKIIEQRNAVIEEANRRFVLGRSRSKATRHRPNAASHATPESLLRQAPAESNQIKPNQATNGSPQENELQTPLGPP